MSSREKYSSHDANLLMLSKELSDTKIKVDKLKRIINHAYALVQKSKEKEHLYEVAGDIIVSAPNLIDQIDRSTSKLLYNVSDIIKDKYSNSLSSDDKFSLEESRSRRMANDITKLYLGLEE